MAKKSTIEVGPVGPVREPLNTAHGFREEVRDYGKDFMPKRDLEDARSIGAVRAARVWSPTRDVKAWRHYRRMV